MNKIALVFAVTIIFAVSAASATRPEEEIRRLLDQQVAAWNRGDIEGFMQGYWRSPQLSFFSGRSRTYGWDETLQRYKNRYKSEGREMGELTFEDLEIEPLSRQAAFVRGRWRLKIRDESLEGVFTLILRKQKEGWRIVHDHTS